MSKTMAVFTLKGTDELVKAKGKFSINDKEELTPLDDEAKKNLAQAQSEVNAIIANWGVVPLWLKDNPDVIVHESLYEYEEIEKFNSRTDIVFYPPRIASRALTLPGSAINTPPALMVRVVVPGY